ncbi:MAG: DNA recombination/repair protein RecA [Chloroflexi bacterium]|nr:DNA recombination/repair protein RecA [Chloroflexota bacterium]
MSSSKQSQLKETVAVLQKRLGSNVIVPASQLANEHHRIPTGFHSLDGLIGGIPLNAITVLSGKITCGKRTLAYKILRHAQQSSSERLQSVSILDLARSTDYDYVSRCGIHLDHLFISTPDSARQCIDTLLDMVRSHQLRAILFNHITLIQEACADWKYLLETLPQLNLQLKNSSCAVIFLDEASDHHARNPLGAQVALHLELHREQWIEQDANLRGYQSRVQVLRNKGRSVRGTSMSIAFDLKTLVRRQEIW